MSEHRAISERDAAGRSLVTRSSLTMALREFGLAPGDVVCVHTSLGCLGYVCGAAETVIRSLLDAVGPEGTIMMPTFSGEHSDPASWRAPPVPASWVDLMRREMPGYDPARTPTRLMGTVAELFRHWPSTVRSPHPHSSFAACGLRSSRLVARHPLHYRFGPASPLGALTALDGKVLLLGAGNDRASYVYLAQTMSGLGEIVTKKAPIAEPDGTRWFEYADIAVENKLVAPAVQHLIDCGVARVGQIGDARAVMFSTRAALAALLEWRWNGTGLDVPLARPVRPIPSEWSI